MTEITKIREIITSHSIDNTFESCPRKFEFLNIYDTRPPRDSGYAADVGTALHNAWQEWLILRAEGVSPDVCEAKAFWVLLRDFPWDREGEQTTQYRSHNNTIIMLYEIMRSSLWDDWELVKIDGRWAVEVPFVIKHTSLGIFTLAATGESCLLITQGKIDAILRHRWTGETRCWDLKTTIDSPNLVRSNYKWSGQQVGYGNVLQAMLGADLKAFTVWYLIARFGANDPPAIEPLPIIKDADDVEDYWLDKLDRLDRIRFYAEKGRFPRRNGGCNAFKHECSCFDICETRDVPTIMAWFQNNGGIPQTPYQPWVVLEL